MFKGFLVPVLCVLLIGLIFAQNSRAQIKQGDVDFKFIDTVTIQKGDTLWELAAKYYNDPLKWSHIKEMNDIPDERAISIGTVIYIPDKDAKRIVSREKLQAKKFFRQDRFPTPDLKISDLIATQPAIGVGDTTTVETLIDYTGDETALIYSWTADAGVIRGTGRRIVYKAPDTPGVYSVSTKVTDGVLSSGKTTMVKVDQKPEEVSLVLDRDVHWPAVDSKDKLAYNAEITRIVGRRVLLHYDISQDKDEFDAFLSIQINQEYALKEMAIGGEQPSTGIRTVRYLDVSGIISGPGQYTVTLYIRPGNRVKNGWLLNEARIVGVEGSSSAQK